MVGVSLFKSILGLRVACGGDKKFEFNENGDVADVLLLCPPATEHAFSCPIERQK